MGPTPAQNRPSLLRAESPGERVHAKLTALGVGALFFLLLEGVIPLIRGDYSSYGLALALIGLLISILTASAIAARPHPEDGAGFWLTLCLYLGAHLGASENMAPENWRLMAGPLLALNLTLHAPSRGTAWASAPVLLLGMVGVDRFLMGGHLLTSNLMVGLALAMPSGLLMRYVRLGEVRLVESLRQNLLLQSNTDELTGLANRGRLLAQGEQEIARARRHRRPMSLILLHLDNLQAIENQRGRQTSTWLLQEMASELTRNIRDIDIAGRLGSHSFMLLLPETPLTGAKQVVNRLGETLSGVAQKVSGTRLLFQLAQAELIDTDHSLEDFIARARTQFTLDANPDGMDECLDDLEELQWPDIDYSPQDLIAVQGRRLAKLIPLARLYILAAMVIFWAGRHGDLAESLDAPGYISLLILAAALVLGNRISLDHPNISFVAIGLGANLSTWLLITGLELPAYYWGWGLFAGLHIAAYLGPGPLPIFIHCLVTGLLYSLMPLDGMQWTGVDLAIGATWLTVLVSVTALAAHSLRQSAHICQLNVALKRISTTDSLTGIFNRPYILEQLSEELSRSRRYGQPVSLLIMRVDGYRKAKGESGAGFADEMLKRVARMTAQTLRRTDLFGRLRGEDFLIVLPGTTFDGATRAAERLRSRLGRAKVRISGKGVEISAGMGIATFSDDEGVLDLLERAESDLRGKPQARPPRPRPALPAVAAHGPDLPVPQKVAR